MDDIILMNKNKEEVEEMLENWSETLENGSRKVRRKKTIFDLVKKKTRDIHTFARLSVKQSSTVLVPTLVCTLRQITSQKKSNVTYRQAGKRTALEVNTSWQLSTLYPFPIFPACLYVALD